MTLVGVGSPLGLEMFWTQTEGWLPNVVNVPDAARLFTAKWGVLCHVNENQKLQDSKNADLTDSVAPGSKVSRAPGWSVPLTPSPHMFHSHLPASYHFLRAPSPLRPPGLCTCCAGAPQCFQPWGPGRLLPSLLQCCSLAEASRSPACPPTGEFTKDSAQSFSPQLSAVMTCTMSGSQGTTDSGGASGVSAKRVNDDTRPERRRVSHWVEGRTPPSPRPTGVRGKPSAGQWEYSASRGSTPGPCLGIPVGRGACG